MLLITGIARLIFGKLCDMNVNVGESYSGVAAETFLLGAGFTIRKQ